MRRKNKKLQSLARRRALAVLARMRSRGESLSGAARNEHTTSRTVRRHVGSALIRDPRTRHFVAKSGDTFRRDINALGNEGYVPVSVRSSKQAQLASEHLTAVGMFLGSIPSPRRGDIDLLKPFIGKLVGGVELLTDPDRLGELADAGLIKLDALYRNNRAGRREE
jgi:hypothetical protein